MGGDTTAHARWARYPGVFYKDGPLCCTLGGRGPQRCGSSGWPTFHFADLLVEKLIGSSMVLAEHAACPSLAAALRSQLAPRARSCLLGCPSCSLLSSSLPALPCAHTAGRGRGDSAFWPDTAACKKKLYPHMFLLCFPNCCLVSSLRALIMMSVDNAAAA